MKVQIEKAVLDLDLMLQIMLIVKRATESKTFDDFSKEMNLLKTQNRLNTNLIKYGRGGNHMWFNQEDSETSFIIEYNDIIKIH